MKVGSRYYPLFEYLRKSGEREVALTFSAIEAIIGVPLPPSARKNVAWWSNRSGGVGQASAWMETKHHALDLDLANERVVFRRITAVANVRRAGDAVLWDGELVKALRLHMGMTQGEFANKLGIRQQTVSEWEKAVYVPTRASSTLLSFVAKEAYFPYTTEYKED